MILSRGDESGMWHQRSWGPARSLGTRRMIQHLKPEGADHSMTLRADDAMIVLSRKRRAYRDGLRKYLVMLDGKQVAKVRRGETVEIPVASGRHEIHLKIDWCRSPSIEFDAHAGEVIKLFVEPAGPVSDGLNDVLHESGGYIDLTRV
jgi:hypothetical protein